MEIFKLIVNISCAIAAFVYVAAAVVTKSKEAEIRYVAWAILFYVAAQH